uniref:Lipocalin n=1 Tax=Rhipicephalus appendiculatus TaxID=34631 RepID=A0A131YPI2_RHIAP
MFLLPFFSFLWPARRIQCAAASQYVIGVSTESSRHSMQLRGDFDLRHTDTMDVRTLGMQALARETMIYLAPNLSCGVMKVGPVGRDTACYYDLRVKNSSVDRIIDAKCWRHFYTVARQETHVYTPACQRDVRPRK